MDKDILDTLKTLVGKQDSMTQDTLNALLLSTIVAINTDLTAIRAEIMELKKLVPLYRLLTVIGGLLLTLIAGLLWGIFTGQATIQF